MELNTQPHLEAPDDFYAALIDTHRDLSTEQSHALNARLVLLLANHIGELGVLKQAMKAARESGQLATLRTSRGLADFVGHGVCR